MRSDKLEHFATVIPSHLDLNLSTDRSQDGFSHFIMDAGGIQGTAGSSAFLNNTDQDIQEVFHDGTLSSGFHTAEDQRYKVDRILHLLVKCFVDLRDIDQSICLGTPIFQIM